MADLPPPYTPRSPPEIVEPAAPPSYDTVAACQADQQQGQQQQQQQQQQRERRRFRDRLSSSSSADGQRLQPVSTSTSSTGSASVFSQLAALRPTRSHPGGAAQRLEPPPPPPQFASSQPAVTEQDVLAELFRMFPWRRSWGACPTNLDEALRQSALIGHEGLVRALLRRGAPITFTDSHRAVKSPGGSALHAALKGAAPQLAETITAEFWSRAYGDAVRDRCGTHEATIAAVADRRTRALLDARDSKGCTPLHVAAEAGATDAARALLRRGAVLDARDEVGRTPLHMAARYGRTETAEYLLGQGADTDHLLPPELQLKNDEWPPKPSAADLWAGARGERLADLGNYGFITQLVGRLVAQERKQSLRSGGGDDNDDGEEDNFDYGSKSGSTERARPRSRSSSNYTSAASSSSAPAPSAAAPVYGHGSGYRPRRSLPNNDPFPLTLASMSLKRMGPLDPFYRPPPSMLQSAEYQTWRGDCETLLAEHRAQRERNKRAEMPH